MDFHLCLSYVIPFSRSLMLLHVTAMHLAGIFYLQTSLLGLFNSRRLLNFKFNEKFLIEVRENECQISQEL